jgi:uncharacterized protein (TIGR03437 family)
MRCALLRGVLAVLATAVAYGAADRITTAVNSGRTTVLRGNLHPMAQARFDRGAAAPDTELRYVTLLFRPDTSLPAFLAAQSTPGTPQYRKWLKPEEFADRFGLSESDIGKLRAWLESQGLRVNDVAHGRHWITFSGTTAQVGRALHTEFRHYLVNGEMHMANAAEPAVPEAFAGVVAGFRGLTDFRPKPLVHALVKGGSPDYTSRGFHYLAPGDIATIYNITPLYNKGITGAGQTVVVAGGSDIFVDDISTFRQMFKLPVNDPIPMLFGADPGYEFGPMMEADLDLEWAGAVAPDANIIYAYSFDPYTALQYAVDENLGQVISLSYGSCELGETSAFQAVAQQANAQGITLAVASGDSGAATCDYRNVTPQASTGPTASWPASFPEVTAVGGTEFDDSQGAYWTARNSATGGSAVSYIPETAWNDSATVNALLAGGGGPSIMFPKPAWQAGAGVPNDGARDLPDVSLAAGFRYPYLVESLSSLTYVVGTSASAQVFAGMLALLNQYLATPGLGNINPALYRMAAGGSGAFHDIASGNTNVPCVQSTPGCVNGMLGFNAAPGFDMATGLGSFDFNLLANSWANGLPTTTTLTTDPTQTTPDAMVQLTAMVKGAGGAAPSGTVSFTVEEVGPIAEPASELPIASAVLDANGTATITQPASLLSLGNGTLRVLYGGDGVYQGSSGSAKLAVDYPQTGASAPVPLVNPNPVVADGFHQWPYLVALVERAGVATTLTSFTVDGVTQNLRSWSATNLPANGIIYAYLVGNLTAPRTRNFVFNGQDAGGAAWSVQLAVPFVASLTNPITPGITLTTATPVVAQNPQAPAACQWAQQISVQETGGFLTLLTSMSVNGVSSTSKIQSIFGTTRLAPYGLLEGTLCFSAAGPSVTQLSGTSSSGGISMVVPATVSATLAPPADTPVAFTAPQPGSTVNLTADASGAITPASIPVNFSGGGSGAAWTVTAGPGNRAASWLKISPQSGNGPGTITVSGSAAGLSPGAYRAVLSVASASAQPQVVDVVVMLTVGGSPSIAIGGIVNNFSGGLTAAPGMIAAVFGTGMAPAGTAALAPDLPLPWSMAGVSATVNGASAPLYYVSPGQVNIQIPYETGAGTAVLAINNNGQVATFAFPVAVTAPGLYAAVLDNNTFSEVKSAAPKQALVLYSTGEGDLTPTLPTGATPATNSNPFKYPQPRQPVTVTVGGVPAQVLYQAVPHGLAGAAQIDFVVPDGAPAGPQQVVVTVGGVAAPGLPLTINTQ